jgi:hypothetical protein
MMISFPKSVSRTSFGEIRQNNGGQIRWQGIATFAEALGYECAPAGQKIAAPVLPDLQRKALVRQRSLFY